MTNLKNQLTKETLTRVNNLFEIKEITIKKDTVFINSNKEMSFEWAKFIVKELNLKVNWIKFKS